MKDVNASRFYDEQEYLSIASNIAFQDIFSIDGEQPTAFRAPLYPFLLSLLLRLGAGTLELLLLNAMLLSSASLLLTWTVGRYFGTISAACIPFLVLSYPVLIYTSSTLYPQTLAAFLLILTMMVWWAWPERTIGRIMTAGVISGLLVLTVPTLIIVPVALAIHLFSVRSFQRSILFMLSVIVVLLPWTLRNASQFHRFIPISTNSGINLLWGNSEGTTPNAGTGTDITRYLPDAPVADEVQRDAYFRDRALRYIVDHPAQSFVMYWRKVANHFNYRNDLKTPAVSDPWTDILMFMTYGLLIVLVSVRVFHPGLPTLMPFERWILILYAAFALVQAVFFTRIRFRLPMDLLLIALCSHSVAMLVERYAPFSRRLYAMLDSLKGGRP